MRKILETNCPIILFTLILSILINPNYIRSNNQQINIIDTNNSQRKYSIEESQIASISEDYIKSDQYIDEDINNQYGFIGQFLSNLLYFEDEIKMIAISSYNINNMTIEENFNSEQEEIAWELVSTIFPDDYEKQLTKINFESDGYGETMAYVDSENENLRDWNITLDPDDFTYEDGSFNYDELSQTIIHELFHIISLNYDQFSESDDDTSYLVAEGRLKKLSYLNSFYKNFWENKYSDLVDIENVDENTYEFLWIKYKNEFVSDYAMTNPEEDIAESFRIFVNEKKPNDQSIKSQKILFFYKYPELIKIRNDIRKAIY